jgi:hypothetical protein
MMPPAAEKASATAKKNDCTTNRSTQVQCCSATTTIFFRKALITTAFTNLSEKSWSINDDEGRNQQSNEQGHQEDNHRYQFIPSNPENPSEQSHELP